MNPIKPLGHYSFESIPTIYDEDALTALELCARTAKKTNECVKAFNDHLNECKDEHQRHETACDDMHKEHTEQVQATLDRQDQTIDGAVDYMKTNLEENCGNLFDQAVENGLFDTVSRQTYQNMTAGVFNVREYGATGDGVTDDTNAIQTAIDNANRVNGSTVYLPAGVYRVTAPLTIYSHTRLIGGGKRGLSETGYSGTHIVGDLDGAIIQTDPNVEIVYGAEIQDLRVCKYGDRKPAYGIYLGHVSECYFHNVTVNGGCAVGVYYKGGIDQLDNLYICANDIGIQIAGAHATTISQLNAWENKDKAIEFNGTCCNVTVRDSWIENSLYGFYFNNANDDLMCHVINIQNTSFTAGSAYEMAEFINAMDVDNNNRFCLQALNVTGCVSKIYNGGFGFVELHSGDYTIKATFADCIFFANTYAGTTGNIRGGIWSTDAFNNITLQNVQCQLYDGTVIPNIGYGGNYLEIKTGSKYSEVNSSYPIKLGEMTESLQTFELGQIYCKHGALWFTDGTQARQIAFVE